MHVSPIHHSQSLYLKLREYENKGFIYFYPFSICDGNEEFLGPNFKILIFFSQNIFLTGK